MLKNRKPSTYILQPKCYIWREESLKKRKYKRDRAREIVIATGFIKLGWKSDGKEEIFSNCFLFQL